MSAKKELHRRWREWTRDLEERIGQTDHRKLEWAAEHPVNFNAFLRDDLGLENGPEKVVAMSLVEGEMNARGYGFKWLVTTKLQIGYGTVVHKDP